jgi:hypothetical protein
MALLHVILGGTESIGNVFQGSGFAEIPDRENASENCFEAGIFSGFSRYIDLEESLIGIFLYVDQIGNVYNFFYLGEVFT